MAKKKAAAKKKVAKKKVAKKKVAKKKVAEKKVAKKKVAKKKRKPNPAFMKLMQISDALAKIVGSINIPADEHLKEVFSGKKQVSMFDMTKLVSKHLK